MTILFRTRHGSHLYGLAHAGSDEDWYTIIANNGGKRKKYARQSIHEGLDSTIVNLSTFRQFCDDGVPQALEALFSPKPELDLLTDFRRSYRINTANTVARYKRTIKNFALDDANNFKKKRHACRLTFNLNTMLREGRFNPQMTEDEIFKANNLAMLDAANMYEILERLGP